MRVLSSVSRAPAPAMKLGGETVRSATASALAALLLLSPLQAPPGVAPWLSPVAQAKELASGSGSRVNKDPNSLLRLGLPSQPKKMRELQANLEESNDNLARVLYANSKGALQKAKGNLKDKDLKEILKAVPAGQSEEAASLLASIDADVDTILEAISKSDLNRALAAQEKSLIKVSKVEEMIASTYKVPNPPGEFAGLPYLKGRAEVEFVLKRPEGKFDVEGTLYDTLNIKRCILRTAPTERDPHALPLHVALGAAVHAAACAALHAALRLVLTYWLESVAPAIAWQCRRRLHFADHRRKFRRPREQGVLRRHVDPAL